jgi:hypothetical protein
MSWLYSQVLVEEYLGDISLDGEQSVPLSGNPIPQAYCAPGKMTDFSRLSRFGMTYKPLTENLGEELLMSFRADFPVRTLVPQEKAQELTEKHQECGEKWQGSFTKWSQDSYSWKTHQCSLVGDLDEFSETWPQWGLMRDGECWEQLTLEQSIKGIAFGLSLNYLTPPPQELAYTNSNGLESDGEIGNTKKTRKQFRGWRTKSSSISLLTPYEHENACKCVRDADVVACRVDRLKAIGNGQVPGVAATAWQILSERN